ncbi:MAG: glycosyltransferase [Bacteroidetes bacterium]|nr:glycosyltransferase [Bacteroidota bacterium]
MNFKATAYPYGGGNSFVKDLADYLKNYKDIKLTYALKGKIDIYLIIDIRQGKYKKYSFEEILNYKNHNPNGIIVSRINDSDSTRTNKSLETKILENINHIDFLVFNSEFIRSYYLEKYSVLKTKPNLVIYNSSNSTFFYPKATSKLTSNRIKIVTHHWSDNINKGYELYYKLNTFCSKHENFEFIFIGRKFNSDIEKGHDKIKVHGPYGKKELGEILRNCDVYVTASINDACPMHVFEGIACGLPILYINKPGGGKDIPELSKLKVGESFNDIDDLIVKLELVVNNYNFYSKNILKNIHIYNSTKCFEDYTLLFRKLKEQLTNP